MRVLRSLVVVSVLIWPVGSALAKNLDVASPIQALAPQNIAAGEPEICRDDNNKVQKSVDLILLLDNSTSLNLAKAPTDEDRLRFAAIQQMLEAVGGAVSGVQSTLEVRFGVITFSADATELISLAENRLVTRNTATVIAREIESRLPNESQSTGTNYLNALEKAFDVFAASSSSDRCRVLVWLTDGEFAHGDSQLRTDEVLKTLNDRMCDEESGFAARARDSKTRIWPFVVLLTPPSPNSIDERRAKIIRDSHDLMRRMTGAPYVAENEPETADCAGRASTSRIGSIYGATEVKKLGPVFEELGALIAGGQVIDACPISSAADSSQIPEYQSIELPAPRFLSWISMVSLGLTQLPAATQISVITPELKEESLLEHLGYRPVSETSLYLDAIQRSRLDSGWKLKVVGVDLEGYCLRAKVIEDVTLMVERKGGEISSLSWSEGAENLTDADLDNVEFLVDGKIVDRSELAQLSEQKAQLLTARLDVDPSGELLVEGLQIKVSGFSVVPGFDLQTCSSFRVPQPGVSGRGDTPSPREFVSSTCRVDLRKVNLKIVVDTLLAQASLQSIAGCENTTLVPVVDGVERSDFAGDRVFDVGVILKFTTNSLQCSTKLLSSDNESLGDAEILVDFQWAVPSAGGFETKQIGVIVDLDVTPPPPPWLVWLITLGSVLLAIILSFGLLWLMNLLLIRLPKPTKFLVARLPLTISNRDPLKPEYKFDDMQVGELALSVSDFEGIRGDQTRWTAGDGFALQRKLSNPLIRPLDEPRALFNGPSARGAVVAYGPLFSESGLKLPFQRALILVLGQPDSPTAPLKGHVFAVVPNDPRDGGLEGAKRLFNSSQMLPLIRALLRSEMITGSSKSTLAPATPSAPSLPQPPDQNKQNPPRRRFGP